jgi:hypothetical protein
MHCVQFWTCLPLYFTQIPWDQSSDLGGLGCSRTIEVKQSHIFFLTAHFKLWKIYKGMWQKTDLVLWLKHIRQGQSK